MHRREEEHQAEIEKLRKENEDEQMRVTELNKEVYFINMIFIFSLIH